MCHALPVILKKDGKPTLFLEKSGMRQRKGGETETEKSIGQRIARIKESEG